MRKYSPRLGIVPGTGPVAAPESHGGDAARNGEEKPWRAWRKTGV